jgi:RHS repeat-associated protein
MPDGSQPTPFPLAAIEVPVDRLPDAKPQVPTMIRDFIVAFQPANASANQPVAVFFPNTINTPPGTGMALMTLDPTHGTMVPYGTGVVSSDATQIVPDLDPMHPGHRYGLLHFDWHGPMPPPPPQTNPGPPGGGGQGTGGGTDPGGTTVAPNPDFPTTYPTPPPPSKPPLRSRPCYDGGGVRGQLELPSDGPGTSLDPTFPQFRDSVVAKAERPYPVDASASPAEAGDPVDLFSGIMTDSNTDIILNGGRGSIGVVRTYRSLTTAAGPFGIGTSHNYNYAIDTAFPQNSAVINYIEPDGNRFPFTTNPCTGTPCPSGKTNATIPFLRGAVMMVNSDNTTDIRWKDGPIYHFIPISFQLGSMLASIQDPNGNTTTIARNSAGNVTSVTDAVGRKLIFEYDTFNRILSITDPIGRSAQYTYNSQGTLATFTDPAGATTRYTYDGSNNMLQIVDPRGITQVQNTLDAEGRVTRQLRPDGGTLTFSYQMLNPLSPTSQVMQAQVTDSLGVQATYRFNPTGFVTDITNSLGVARHMERASGTNLLVSTTAASSSNTYTYDVVGNVLTSTDPTGITTSFTYDPIFNNITSITDGGGNKTIFTYDAHGNLLTKTDPNGHVISNQYDSNGLLTQTTDAAGQQTTYTYDTLGNVISVKDPAGLITSYRYDGISRLIGTTDPLGRKTTYTYDAVGRRLSTTDTIGSTTTYTYDANGNVTSAADPKGNTVTYVYDVMNRLVTRTDALGTSETLNYDANGNMIKHIDRRGQVSTFTYDNLNRLVTESYPDSSVTRIYDVLGNLAEVDDSAGGTFAYAHDAAGRVTSSTTPAGSVTYTFDARGLISSRQVAGQPAVSYAYDPAGNLLSASMPQASASFSYNPRNQVAGINRLNGVSTSFTYDADARLLVLAHALGTSTIDTESYTYNAAGMRVSHVTNVGQSLTTQPTANVYNSANQLTIFGSTPFSYDGNGNLMSDGTATYTWDGRNRLTSITPAGGQSMTVLTYDYSGNLIGQAVHSASGDITKQFVLDDLTNIAYVSSSDGASYSVLAGRSIDSHLATIQPTGVLYGLADALNSTVLTVDQNGSVTSQLFYEPYGRVTTTGSYPFQFTGRTAVSPSLSYFRTRYYNPVVGRFVSEDPLNRPGGNAYGYVNQSPLNGLDPLGLCTGVVL